jgi:hypothetical protein
MGSRLAIGRVPLAGVFIILFTSIIAVSHHLAEVESDCSQPCQPQIVPSFWLAGLFAVSAAVVLFAPRAAPETGLKRPVQIWRRVCAFIIDWHVLLLPLTALLWALQYLFNGLVGGLWNWISPATETSAEATLEVLGLILLFSSTIAYFWLHPKFGKASPGQYIMGYRIIPDPEAAGQPLHFLRMVAAYFALITWLFWIWFIDSEGGHYWWDRLGRSKAVFVGPY